MEIYLDNAATTRPVIDKAVTEHLEGAWYNPSAAYKPAEEVFARMNKTRQILFSITGLSQCIFTSGGTEANNMAIMSAYRGKSHYITSSIEHPSVYNTFKYLETLGASVDYVKPRDFCIYAQDVAAMVRDDTALVSVMHVNNETGALNDINAIAGAVKTKNKNTLFHSDGVQALFKTRIDLPDCVDYYTLSAHKVHGLKGTGVLLAGERKMIRKLFYGGEQEFSIRPGTENTLGIQAFDEALQRGAASFPAAEERIFELHQALLQLLESIEGAKINLPGKKVPHIVSVSFPGVKAQVLVRALGQKRIYIGTGAACSRGKISRVLLESGVARNLTQGAVRISMSEFTTRQEIEACAEEIQNTLKKLRKIGGE